MLRKHSESFHDTAMKFSITTLIAILFFFTAAGAAEKVRVSVTNYNLSYLSAGVAAQRGFFKEEGLDVEIVRMNANVAMSSLIAGEVDYTMIFASVIRAAMRGIPLKVIAVLIDSPPYAFIARPEIAGMKALKGKTVGIGVYGSSNDIIARMMLERSGIDPDKETKLVAFGTDGARFAALKEGLVDAAIIAPPADAQARKLGLSVLARANDFFKFPHIGLGTSNKKLKENPQEVVRVIRAFIKANWFIRDHRQEAISVLIDWGRTQREDAVASYDSTWQVFSSDGAMPDDGMRLVIDDAQKALKLSRVFAINEVADAGPLREAQRSLGIKAK
jgi:ABC-type nitrate/sulfonate/bicarbonate transport system substrate-binding protein